MKAIDKTVRLGDKKFSKHKFLSVFQSFQSLMFKPTRIQHIFKSPYLVYFNLYLMLDKICENL